MIKEKIINLRQSYRDETLYVGKASFFKKILIHRELCSLIPGLILK